jgi:hypothetical protein
MEDKELLNIIFTYKNIEQKSWIFDVDIDWKTIDIGIYDDNDNYIIWHYGIWNNGTWINGLWNKGTWNNGIWKDGTWKRGIWNNGAWNGGYWNSGTWENGIWNDGIWFGGTWKDGIWKGGTWGKGRIYNPKTGEYKYSTLPPSKCKWSTSYER